MKTFKIFITCFLLFLLERLIFSRFQIFSLTTWLVFSFCLIGGAIANTDYCAIITVVIYALISDLMGGGRVGSSVFAFGLAVWLVQIAVGKIFKNSFLVSVISVFFATVIGELTYFLLNISSADISFGGLLWSFILPLSVINTITALLLYYPAKYVFAERRAK